MSSTPIRLEPDLRAEVICSMKPSPALLLLLCACGKPPVAAPSAGPQVDLKATVSFLADPAMRGREEGSEGGGKARAHLIAQLSACGVQPAGDDGFEQRITTGKGTNVLGRIRGSAPSGPGPLIGAHYDHQDLAMVVHPGAYDNATAVAATLQIACRLANDPPANDVIVAFWDAEEPPTFLTPAMGSQFWVAHPTAEVSAALILDLVGSGLWDGYPGTFALGAEHSPELLALGEQLKPRQPLVAHHASLTLVEDLVVGKHQAWSDYDAFRDQRVPFVFFTDGQNRRYHTAYDTVDAVDFDKLAAQSIWVEAWARGIADAPTPPTWAPKATPDRDVQTVATVLADALGDKGMPDLKPNARAALTSAQEHLDHKHVHSGAQRLLCWAGPTASAIACGML